MTAKGHKQPVATRSILTFERPVLGGKQKSQLTTQTVWRPPHSLRAPRARGALVLAGFADVTSKITDDAAENNERFVK